MTGLSVQALRGVHPLARDHPPHPVPEEDTSSVGYLHVPILPPSWAPVLNCRQAERFHLLCEAHPLVSPTISYTLSTYESHRRRGRTCRPYLRKSVIRTRCRGRCFRGVGRGRRTGVGGRGGRRPSLLYVGVLEGFGALRTIYRLVLPTVLRWGVPQSHALHLFARLPIHLADARDGQDGRPDARDGRDTAPARRSPSFGRRGALE